MSKDLLRPAFSFSSNQGAESSDSSKKLIVEIGEYHVAYAIATADRTELLEFMFYSTKDRVGAASFVAWYTAHLESRHFDNVMIVHHTNRVALLPTTFFRQEDAPAVINLLHGDADTCTMLSTELPELSIVVVYAIEVELFQAIAARFPRVNHVHTNHVLLTTTTPGSVLYHKDAIKLFFYPSNFIVLVMVSGKLQLLQQYYYTQTDDVSYRLLNAFAQIGLDPHQSTLSISGAITEDTAMLHELNKLFQHVVFESLDHPFPQHAPLDVPIHFFTPSLLALTCV